MIRAIFHRARRSTALALGLLYAGIALPSLAHAEALAYTIAVPDGEAATYSLDLDVRHPGPLSVRAEWSGTRKLSLRLVPPTGAAGAVHRAGPSPQRIEATVDASSVGTWTLRVHALAAAGTGAGSIAIELPEQAVPVGRPGAALAPPPPGAAQASEPAQRPETWMAPRPVPAGAPARVRPFLQATERLRSAIAAGGPGPSDVCQWQVGLLGYLDRKRDAVLGPGIRPTESTAKLLARIARAAHSVEDLRTSRDPLVVGPAPRETRLRDAWVRLRATRFEPVESELDRVLAMLRRDFAPELSDEPWPTRYVSCLTACERFFEERVRVGDAEVHNRELALEQWPTILTAADALAALASVSENAAEPEDTSARR